MSDTVGSVKDLDASRIEALQGLLHTLGHADNAVDGSDARSTEQLQKLSEKIEAILGDGENRGLTPGDKPTQLLNEDGLPIVDISEPADDISRTSTTPLPTLEQDLIPLSCLSPDERERRRRERDRILDLLEEEERLQQLREERDAEEERKEAIRKRKESAKAELDRLKAARELQKKMGQALVRNAKGAGENAQDAATTYTTRKSVSFADPPAMEARERDQGTSYHQPDWGDVTPGRLRAQNLAPLVSTTEAQVHPVKMRVVERPTATALTSSLHNGADSDDEPPPSTGYPPEHFENDSSVEESGSPLSDNGLSDDGLPEHELDYDAAQHHREIALEYLEKRHAIGARTAEAMSALTLDDPNRQETSQSTRQSPLSRFRADRMAAAYDRSHTGPVSTSVEHSAVPASRQKSLQNSVRLGKLENDQLVGGEPGESGSEDEAVREVIQMLRMGNIQNVGPDFEPSSMATISPSRNSDTMGSPSTAAPISPRKAKPSKFRVAHGGGLAETPAFPVDNSKDHAQSQPTVSGVVERKAPRSTPSHHFPVNKPPPRTPVNSSEPVPTSPATSASSSPFAHSKMTGTPLPHEAWLARSPSVDSSATRDSTIQSRVPTKDPSSVERRASKFMAERRKVDS